MAENICFQLVSTVRAGMSCAAHAWGFGEPSDLSREGTFLLLSSFVSRLCWRWVGCFLCSNGMRKWLRDQGTQVAKGTLPLSASDSEEAPQSAMRRCACVEKWWQSEKLIPADSSERHPLRSLVIEYITQEEMVTGYCGNRCIYTRG